MKTLNAFILASIWNAFTGFMGIITGLCLWESGTEQELPPFIALNVLNIFLCFVYGVIFLLPLATFRKEEIKSNDIVWLFKQYLPLITVIPTAIFLLIFFNRPNSSNVQDSEPQLYVLLMIPAVLLSQQAVGLWQFLKTIKKQWE